jgi:hypothetical protein
MSLRNFGNSNYLILIKSIQVGDASRKLMTIRLDAIGQQDPLGKRVAAPVVSH